MMFSPLPRSWPGPRRPSFTSSPHRASLLALSNSTIPSRSLTQQPLVGPQLYSPPLCNAELPPSCSARSPSTARDRHPFKAHGHHHPTPLIASVNHGFLLQTMAL
ncbi:hypothetical protein GOP47_0017169 [Adiantum capillus-veneris]|uniref:Uncharacterized protein n=1 Tax=Adiantum capillus-veneris TaxID=13818 RepID=A0A9D4UJ36_ADICA|nr:hypothetical protein GOP47_0017169 [Adiantum capillus-veneris]